MIGFLTLKVFWNSGGGKPIVNSVIPVLHDTNMMDLVAKELQDARPNDDIDFAKDIKSITSIPSRTDVMRLSSFPISVYFNNVKETTSGRELHIIVTKPIPKTARSITDMLMRPTPMLQFESKHSEESVTSFLDNYYDARSKADYLSSFSKEEKPSFDEQHHSYVTSFCNEKALSFKGGASDETETANKAMKKLVVVLQYVTDNQEALMDKKRTLFAQSELFRRVRRCIRTKVNQGKKKRMQADAVLKKMKEAHGALHAFPTSWYKKNEYDQRYAEALFAEIEIIIMILGTHHTQMIEQQGRSLENRMRDTGTVPDVLINTETKVLPADTYDKLPSEKLQQLCEMMRSSKPYTVFHLSDEMMGVTNIATTPQQRSYRRKKFIKGIKFPFKVGMFTFRRLGSVCYWVAICKLERGDTNSSNGFQAFVQQATRDAPTLLSYRQTDDAVLHISNACGADKRLARALLLTTLPDGTQPKFESTKLENSFIDDVTRMIIQSDGKVEIDDFVTDMRCFNGQANKTRFDVWWSAVQEVLENQNGSGAHSKRHAAADTQTTTDVSFAPGIVSMPQLIEETKRYLIEVKKMKENEDFFIPSESWTYLQLSPNNDYKQIATRYTGRLKFRLTLQSRDAHDYSHPAGHWNSAMKRIWRYEIAQLLSLLIKNESSEDATPCLSPRQALVALGADDKAGIPVGHHLPVSATSRQSARAIMRVGDKAQGGDHDFHFFNLSPSVLVDMNLSTNPMDSLYSGGKDGHGRIIVSLHDRTLEPSSGLSHAAHYYQYLLKRAKKVCNSDDVEELKRCMPLVLLIETDGGPDHNPTFLRNILALFGLFLVGNMDKLVATRCCSGLSYLNVAERAMSLLNIGLSALSLQIDPEADDFLLEDVLAGCNSMETSRLSIKAYDDAVQIAIRIIERRMGKEATSGSNSNDDVVDASPGNTDESNANNTTKYKVGDKISTFWPGHGTFQGTISLINRDNEEGKCIRVKYEDDDEGDFTEAEIDEMVKQSQIPIGSVGFKFVRKFRGGAVFNGTVISVKSDDKIICRYDDPNDNKKYTHTITQLEKYSMYKLEAEEDDDSERESDDESDTSDVEEVVANNDDGGDNDDSAVIVPAVVAKQDKEAPYRNKHVRKLSVVPPGMNTEEYLNMLKQRRTAHESFLAATGYAKEKVESRFRKLKLDGRDVQITDYSNDADRSIITDALKKFDDAYDETYSSKSKQKLMPEINKFLSCPKHCRMTPYTVEFRLCGEEGCTLCARVGRRVRTPEMVVEGINVREELLRFMTLPILNPEDTKHYLPPDEARRHIREKKLTADDLRKMIPDSKRDKRDKDWEARRAKDKKKKWDATKLRAVLTCTRCGGPRCVFSMNAVGSTNGPTEEDLHGLHQSIEAANGYVCGDNIAEGRKFYSRRAMRCGMPIESQYYNPKTGTKGGRIVVSDDVCAICYVAVEDGNDMAASDEMRTKFNLGGKMPLPICRGCFDDGVEPPCSGGRKNVRQAEMQKKQQKKRQRKDAEERGRRKSRKGS